MPPKKKEKKSDPGAPAWMVTYSDMVTLLLTFFVLLLSMASMDKVKFLKVANSMNSAFGVLGNQDSVDVTRMIVQTGSKTDDLVQRVYKRLETQLNQLKLTDDVTLAKDRGAVVLRIEDSVLFDQGGWELKPEALSVIAGVAELVRPMPLHLRTEGYTDDIPFSKDGMNNWDLSMMRSVAIIKFLDGKNLFPLERMSAVGYGSQHPLVPNDSPENRAKNRRVEFVLESVGGYNEELPYIIDARDQLPF